jgi:hypothetical protein
MKTRLVLFLGIGFLTGKTMGQSRWMIGASAGAAISKTAYFDTLDNNFTTRNRIGGYGNLQLSYDLNRASSLLFSVGYLNAGYKINNDTMAYNTSVNKGIHFLNLNLGMALRQQFGKSNYISEKFGLGLNYALGGNPRDTFNNQEPNTRFRIIQEEKNRANGAFYVGVAFGGNTEGGNRYEFHVTYFQPFASSYGLRVQHSEFFSKEFPLNYRSANLQIGINYYFNFGNFQKTEEYFYD